MFSRRRYSTVAPAGVEVSGASLMGRRQRSDRFFNLVDFGVEILHEHFSLCCPRSHGTRVIRSLQKQIVCVLCQVLHNDCFRV